MTARTRLRATAVAVLAAALLSGAVPTARAATVVEPHADPFYVPAPGFEAAAPGTVLRTRTTSVTGLGLPIPVDATQALVRSTDAHGRPMAIVTTLMIPKVPSLHGPRPLLSYQPAIDSLGDQCQPSYTLPSGIEKELLVVLPALLQGWAVTISDYQGPKNAYGAGKLEGQATLDGARGALKVPGTGLSPATKVALWGYSGGALATGWAAQLAPTYAPDLHIVGVAAGGTPGDLEAAGRTIDGGPFAGLFLAAAIGVSREYPEILALFNDRGRALAQEFGDLCVTDESSRHSFAHLSEFTDVVDPLADPRVQAVLLENKLGAAGPTAPVFLYHSVFDELIPFSSAKALRARWCSHGTKVQFVRDAASEHISYAFTGAPAALLYLMDRVAGRPARSNCPA